MDWKTVFVTFTTVFVAELGDKTQLATLALTTDTRSKLSVFVGSAAALVSTSLMAVLVGKWLGRHVAPIHLKRAAGILFIGLGLWTLWRAGAA
jgi:putative Ca2+/H+ antiporter (TMEM165/GDT1 family)